MHRRDFLTSLGSAGVLAAAGAVTASVEAQAPTEIPVTHDADVVVAGASEGGLGGCMAAIAAARRGAKVILVEGSGHIGLHIPIGLGVVIGIPGWKPTMREGLFKELAERVFETGQHDSQVWTKDAFLDSGRIIIRYHDVVSTAITKMLLDAGVRVLFHARPADVTMRGDAIDSLVVQSAQGRHAIRGKAFVDSTGLADLAAAAGAPMLREEAFIGLQVFIGNVEDRAYQQWSDSTKQPIDPSYKVWLEGLVGPFEKLKYPWDQWWPEMLGDRYGAGYVAKFKDAHDKGRITLMHRRGDGVMAIPEGVKVTTGCARPRTYITGLDPLNVDDVSWCESMSRIMLMEYQRFLRDYIPGFEKSVMERIADRIAWRSGRFIKVEQNITAEQISQGQKNPDCIFVFKRGEEREKKDYEVPFRALIPQKVRNLLVVGKATAAGQHMRAAHAVLFQGQAAGIAAAMAVEGGKAMSEIDLARLQEELRNAGVVIP
jgi:hypothetical protein